MGQAVVTSSWPSTGLKIPAPRPTLWLRHILSTCEAYIERKIVETKRKGFRVVWLEPKSGIFNTKVINRTKASTSCRAFIPKLDQSFFQKRVSSIAWKRQLLRRWCVLEAVPAFYQAYFINIRYFSHELNYCLCYSRFDLFPFARGAINIQPLIQLFHEMANEMREQIEFQIQILQVFLLARDTRSTAVGNALFHLARNPNGWTDLRHTGPNLGSQSLTFGVSNWLHRFIAYCFLDNPATEPARVCFFVRRF